MLQTLERLPPIQFSHSNGFPASSYQRFFEFLAPYKVSKVEIYGVGKHKVERDWRPLVKELIEDIEKKHRTPVIGIGHSLGGVITFWAAIERPDLFEKVIFIDPPLFRPVKRLVMRAVSLLGFADKIIPPASSTKKRRRFFDSKEEAYELWRHKRLFKSFDVQSFEDYVNHGLVKSEKNGVTLAIPPELEYKIFTLTPALLGRTDFQIPSYFLYSNQMKTIEPSDLKWLKKKFFKTEFIGFDEGHMFPMENPQKAAILIKSLISSTDAPK